MLLVPSGLSGGAGRTVDHPLSVEWGFYLPVRARAALLSVLLCASGDRRPQSETLSYSRA